MLVTVRNKHLQAGVRNRTDESPIALALTEQLPLPPGYYWSVCWPSMSIRDFRTHEFIEIIGLPPGAVILAAAFDEGHRCRSITFEV